MVWDGDMHGFGIPVYASGRKVWCVRTRGPAGGPKGFPLTAGNQGLVPEASSPCRLVVKNRERRRERFLSEEEFRRLGWL